LEAGSAEETVLARDGGRAARDAHAFLLGKAREGRPGLRQPRPQEPRARDERTQLLLPGLQRAPHGRARSPDRLEREEAEPERERARMALAKAALSRARRGVLLVGLPAFHPQPRAERLARERRLGARRRSSREGSRRDRRGDLARGAEALE